MFVLITYVCKCQYRMFVSILNVYVLMTNVCFFLYAPVLFLLFFVAVVTHTYVLVYAHVYTRTCLHHSLYRASQGLSDGEIRMLLSFLVRVWQPVKAERCMLRISDFEKFVSPFRLRRKQKGIYSMTFP